MIKFAEVSGTGAAPAFPSTETTTPLPSKAVVRKTAMAPHVDVTGREAPSGVSEEKRASRYALRGRYPLDRLDHVKQASAYFEEWWKQLLPEDRHEYAVNLVKRASELGVPVSPLAQKYGSETFASAESLKTAFIMRRNLLDEEGKTKHAAMLDALEQLTVDAALSGEKVAAWRGVPAGPAFFATVLEEFDKQAGLDRFYDSHVPDAYLSIFGDTKTAEFSETLGNLTVTATMLGSLARKGKQKVRDVFGEDLAKEFVSDPVGIYKSLPVEQRKVLGNLASSVSESDL